MARRIARKAAKAAPKAAAKRIVPGAQKKKAQKRVPGPAAPEAAAPAGAGIVTYTITLRTIGAQELAAKAQDRVLYPLTVAWNRVLDARESGKAGWHQTSKAALKQLAADGEVSPHLIDPFIKAAAKSGIVEVEMEWIREDLGWAARLFPWETLLSMATKTERDRLQQPNFTVVRVLKRKANADAAAPAAGPLTGAAYAPCNAGLQYALDFAAELDAMKTGLGQVTEVDTTTLSILRQTVTRQKPSIIHFAANDLGAGPMIATVPKKPEAQKFEEVAAATASHCPDLAVYSCCYSGRRLAPYAVAIGAKVAVGFQGDVYDDSVPLFFGPFYSEWNRSKNIVNALRDGLNAHNSQRNPDDLGGVTVWSAVPILSGGGPAQQPEADEKDNKVPIEKAALADAFRVDYLPHGEFNYSVLHNDRAGLFQTFTLTKKLAGSVPPVRVTVKVKTGVGDPTECTFSVQQETKAFAFTDLAQRVALPLGAQLIRQRGEALWATLETLVTCDGVTLHEDSSRISILPCDEWRDDKVGQHFLPSFVFSRNPAIRDVISAAQPFLRVLLDTPQAGFDGYLATFTQNRITPQTAVEYQVRAIWASLQYTLRLDYVNSAPTHTKQSQRLRTPDEILRSRRGTCIELALLLASCLEHVGIYSVLFLVPGHAFAGYWTSVDAHTAFTKESDEILKKALPNPQDNVDPNKEEEVRFKPRTVNWRYNARHHPEAILNEVRAGALVVLETTGIAFQNSFEDSKAKACRILEGAVKTGRPSEHFDAMLDVKLARKDNVTPLPILVDGVHA